MARIRIVDEWLRSPASPPTYYRSVMVVAERWAEQRVLMRAYSDSADQTRPTIVLHGHELAIGPASLDPNGPWGIHVQPPADGRAQALKDALEVAARRMAGSKGNPPRLEDELSDFDRKRTNNWAPGDPRDVSERRAAGADWDPALAASQHAGQPASASGLHAGPLAPGIHAVPAPVPHHAGAQVGSPAAASASLPATASTGLPPGTHASTGLPPGTHASSGLPPAAHGGPAGLQAAPPGVQGAAAGYQPGAGPASMNVGSAVLGGYVATTPGAATVFPGIDAGSEPGRWAVPVPQHQVAAYVPAAPAAELVPMGAQLYDAGPAVAAPVNPAQRRTPVRWLDERRPPPHQARTQLGYSSGAGAQSAVIRLGLRPAVAARLARIVDRTVPPDFEITQVERAVLNALGEREHMTARAIGELVGVVDGVAWMEALVDKLERHNLDIIAPGEPSGSEPTYVLRA